MSAEIVSVSEFLEIVNVTLKHIPTDTLAVEGEVSDFRIAQGKWVSFDLKDEEEQAVLKCFMTTWQLKVPLEDGMRVQVKGSPKVYERFGSFKMNVHAVEPVGEGALRRAYELLKTQLEQEGLFDVSRKRELPRFVQRIGLITSRDAAAYGDFVRILSNRWGAVSVDHAHVHVQGRQAVKEIVEAFAHFNACEPHQQPDVLVLTRGGGGLEDLHAFNDEQVARAIYASRIPVVVAVGHERDESLADFVADVRASTPSNAAERVVPSRSDIQYELETLVGHMESRLCDVIQDRAFVLDRATNLLGFVMHRQVERLDQMQDQLMQQMELMITRSVEHLSASERVLRQVDPQRVLARGYSLVRSHGRVVQDASTLEVGADLTVQFAAGSADARVTRVHGRGQQTLV